MARQRTVRKVRVTMTIEPKTVVALDQAVEAHGFPSRSRALEAALNYWLAQQKQQQIEREVQAYYRSLTVQEKREDKEWAEFASRQVARR
ncbi:MAG: ribbon-helix-helix protein, CopG family [candidate division NC10 bacterium]|nr:ribbon-helix-helix protein, CopG family [candidate division NC10 bacterium]